MSNNKIPAQRQTLDMQLASQIAGALQRINELSQLSVQLPAHVAEIKGNHEFLANTLIQHADELLGCWFTVRREYEPLIRAFSTVAFRVSGVLAKTAAPEPEVGEAPVDSQPPSNVIQLDKTIKV